MIIINSEFFKKELNIPEINFREAEKRLGDLWKTLLNVDDDQQRLKICEKVQNHIGELVIKYGRDFCQKTLSFHIFSDGSVFDEERMAMEREDFPGEDSLEKFANGILEQRREKNKN